MDTPFSIPQEINNPDEFVIRKAKIYKIFDESNNKLQVWPLPDLANIPENEYDNLPIYQPFFPGTFTTGKSVVADGKDKADLVWCICTRDHQVGYILGLCSQFYWDNKEKTEASSVKFKALADYCRKRKCWSTDFKYEDLVIVKAAQNPQRGGMIEFYNRNTGDWFLINSAGSMITVQRDKMYLRVGSPSDSSGVSSNFSSIELTANSINLMTNEINFSKCQSIIFGHSGQLLATIPSGTSIGRNGVMVNSASNIHV
ncbi:MAG: hypothetical protein HUJ68_07395 [Clostridia bacterium]|nr:hypothetical protein [Clostridia bacterium]